MRAIWLEERERQQAVAFFPRHPECARGMFAKARRNAELHVGEPF